MKKISIIIALCSMTFACVFAQEEVADENATKEEITYPSAGTFSVGVDAMPYINFVGNMFNGTANNSLAVPQTTIYGKYFLSKRSAVRFELTVGNTNTNEYRYQVDQSQTPIDNAIQVEDLRMTRNKTMGLGAGYQEYLGNGRLRAFYGGQMLYTFSRTSYEYKWGNQMTVDNTSPISTNWTTMMGNSSNRDLKNDNGSNQSINLGAFVGVEYFVNSIIAVGGEASLYASYGWSTQADLLYETVEQGAHVEKTLAITPPQSTFSLTTSVYDNSMAAGRIYINFYF